jgi:hypothetical protein
MALFDCNTCSTAKNKEIFNPEKTLKKNDNKEQTNNAKKQNFKGSIYLA